MGDINKAFTIDDIESTVQRYVMKKMSEEEADQFEAFFLSKPDIIDMIEIAQNINTGIAEVPLHVKTAPTFRSDQNGSVWATIIDWITAPIPPIWPAMTMLALFVPILLTQTSTQNAISFSEQPTIIGFTSGGIRGERKVNSINLTEIEGEPALFLKLPEVEYENYLLQILEESDQIVWESQPFQVSSLRDKIIILPAHLPRKKYQVTVSGVGEDGQSIQVDYCHYSEPCLPN